MKLVEDSFELVIHDGYRTFAGVAETLVLCSSPASFTLSARKSLECRRNSCYGINGGLFIGIVDMSEQGTVKYLGPGCTLWLDGGTI